MDKVSDRSLPDPSLLARVRRIHIIASRKVNEMLSGQYLSAFKGRGLSFEEVREYVPGDEVRLIDWNVTARMARPYVKVHREERELTVLLGVDVSPSMQTGIGDKLKLETAAEMSAVLAFSAIYNNDNVASVVFDSEVREFIPPRKGPSHVWRVIRSVLLAKPEKGRRTSLKSFFEHVASFLKKRTVLFPISDFEDEGYEKMLYVVSRKHDVIPVVVFDPLEISPPEKGFVAVEDPETGERVWVDFSDDDFRNRLVERGRQKKENLKRLFRSIGLDYIFVVSGEDVIQPTYQTFRLRERRVRVA